MVLPHGILFRGGAEGRIRQGMLKDDIIEAVIGLGPNLFYGAGIPACILLVNKNKPVERTGKVLFVNGTDELVVGKAQNHLSETNVKRMVGAYHAFVAEEKFVRVVSLEEIEKNDFNLNIARYVQNGEDEERTTLLLRW